MSGVIHQFKAINGEWVEIDKEGFDTWAATDEAAGRCERRRLCDHDAMAAELDQLKAKLAHQEIEAGTLAERMKAAGMMTVDELLAGAPLDAFHRHAGVNSLETFGQWLEMRRREYVTMHAKRTLDKREDDDLYEWVLAHSGVFGEVHINFKAAMAGHEKNG